MSSHTLCVDIMCNSLLTHTRIQESYFVSFYLLENSFILHTRQKIDANFLKIASKINPNRMAFIYYIVEKLDA